MSFLSALKALLPSRKPKRSKLLAPLIDPRFEHPAYKNIPEELLRALGDPTYLRSPPYHDGYYGLISGEFCMRKFQGKLLGKIKRQSGLSPEEYSKYLEPILIAYAELVHLLPASEHHHHNTPGGLLRHGLEAACFMLDWMVTTKFDHELTPGEASKRLRRWYVAGIIAALFHDAGKPLTDVRVMSFEGDKEWFMGTRTIHEWAVAHNISRYFLTWVKGRDEKHLLQTTMLIGTFVSTEVREWLIEGGKDIWEALLSATTNQPGPLTQAVKNSDSRSVRADRERCGSTEGEATTGVPVQRLCVDAMRFLLDEGIWKFNEPGARLWKSTQGVFLAWGSASVEIVQHVIKDKVGGFPRGEISLLAAMAERELIEKNADGTPIWFVTPHIMMKDGKGPSIRCVKLKNPDGVFPSVLGAVSAISVTIGRDESAKEYLCDQDAQAKAAEKKAAKQSPQRDLLATLEREAPGALAEGAKRKGKAKTAAPERKGVKMSPELALQAAQLQQEQAQPSQPAEQAALQEPQPSPASKPEAEQETRNDLRELDDETLTSMLIDMSGLQDLPVQDTPEVQGPEPATEQPEQAEQAEQAVQQDEAHLEEANDTLNELSNKGYKLTLNDLLKKPEEVKNSKLKDRHEKVTKPRLVVPEVFQGQLTEQDQKYFMANPELGSRLLELFASTGALREVRNRAFVPLIEPLSEADLPSIISAGWLWRDYTSPDEAETRTLRKVLGFLASKQLSEIYCRITSAKWTPKAVGQLPTEKLEQAHRIAAALRKAAVPEPDKAERVFSLTFYACEKVYQAEGIDAEGGDDALLYILDAVKVSRDKKHYFQLDAEDSIA